jgi:hypothetical protein
MKVGDKIKLKAKENASNRTKNRIREHGDHAFEVFREPEHCQSLDGSLSVLLKTEGWFGWLIVDEIEVVK